MRPIGRFISLCPIYLFDTMFNATQSGLSSDLAGALSTDDINMYQAVGTIGIVGTMTACTLGGVIVAPAPVGLALAGSIGLAVFGDKIADHKFSMGKDSAADSKSEAKTEAPAKPAAGTAVSV